MVVAAKKLQELEISIESFFLGKWIFEKDYPCIPAKHLYMPKLRSHDTKKINRNTENETPLVSSESPSSAVVKRGKRKDIVFDILTPDKSKGRSIKRNKKKAEKVSGNSETAYPRILSRKLSLESGIHFTKKTDVFEIVNPDGQLKDKGRGVKRKKNKLEIIESQAETTGTGLSTSTVPLRKSQRIQNRENNERSAQHLERKLTKKACECLKDISNSTIKQTSKKGNGLEKTIRCKEKEPNKDGHGETGRSSRHFGKKVENEPKKKSKYRPGYSECELEKNDTPIEKVNEPSKDGQDKNLARKAKTRMGSYQCFLEDGSDDAHDETWMEPTVKKKKIAVKKLENDKRRQSVMEDKNKTKTARSQNKTSEQKKMQNENSKQGADDNVNARKTKVRIKKASTEESKKAETADEVAATTYSRKKQKENLKPDDNVNARKTKVRTKKASEKSKKAKTADEVAATTYSQKKQKENLKPEDCVVTAKQGTLRYLKQRERLLEAKTKEAEVEDDYFSNNLVLREKKNVLNQLLAPASHDDSLTIKTPKSKGTEESDSVITPRTALLGRFGTVTPSSHAITPCTSSPLPSKSKSRDAALEVMFHQMKGAKKRPRVIRKNHKDNFMLSDSMLKKLQAPQLLELPVFSDASESDLSHDEYFNYSDTI